MTVVDEFGGSPRPEMTPRTTASGPRPVLLAAALAMVCQGCARASPIGEMMYESADGSFSLRYLSPPWLVRNQSAAVLELEIPASLFGVPLEGTPPTHLLLMSHADDPGGIEGLVGSSGASAPTPGIATGSDTDAGTDTGTDTDADTDGLPPLPAEIPEQLPEGIPDAIADKLPTYLLTVDLNDPHSVALAELNYLVGARKAQLDHDPESFTTTSGVEGVVFQVQLNPGVYFRSYYFPAATSAVRATFATAFDPSSEDIRIMARTINTSTVEVMQP